MLAVTQLRCLSILGLAAACSAAVPSDRRLPFAFPFERYPQEVVITFADADTAGCAEIELEPLPGGFTLAVSCRWDDSIEQNLAVKERLDARGIKSTWYLNSNTIVYLNQQDYRPIARKLLENGHSIGGHSYSHPYLMYVNRNRMFQEAAAVRIEWESQLDTLLTSYSFSFVNYRNPLEGAISHQDALRVLERAGFYHLAEYKTFDEQQPSEMMFSIIMPPENQDFISFKQAVDWAMTDKSLLERYLCISHSMHGWYGTPAVEYGLDELDKRLDYLNSFVNLWQCNQNQYAAYRYQYLNTHLEIVRRQGKQLRLRLTRPVLQQLNDATPLTVAVKRVPPESVVAVEVGQKIIAPVRHRDNKTLLDIPHDPAQHLPLRIGHIDNPQNCAAVAESDQDPDFPGLRLRLSFDGKLLSLKMANDSPRHLTDVHILYRLPLAWKEGIRPVKKKTLKKGQHWEHTWEPTLANSDLKYNGGSHYFVAQVDFMQGQTPGRLYATCSNEVPFDATFPRDGFVLLGPIEPNQFEDAAFGRRIESTGGIPPTEWTLPDGTVLKWRPTEQAGPVPIDHFDPEVIPTQRDWYKSYSPVYLLYSTVYSSKDQSLKAIADWGSVRAVYVNGVNAKTPDVPLRQGENHLVIVHSHEQFTGSGEHAGCFFRLAEAAGSGRLTGLRYQKPSL